MRGGLRFSKVEAGTLRGAFGDTPWLENLCANKDPPDTLRAFDALMGTDSASRANTPIEALRSWVSAAAPPLVYDAARVREERRPGIQRRNGLAAMWHAKADERNAMRPYLGPPNFYRLRLETEAKLRRHYSAGAL
jgi:hypothetical protein